MSKVLATQEASYAYINKTLEVFLKSSQTILPHFIISGGTGTGKSVLIEMAARKHSVPFLSINGAQVTPEGVAGTSWSKLLVPLKEYQNKPCILFIDEFDKLFDKSIDKQGAQQELLHIISARKTTVIGQFGHYDTITLNRTLFVFAGAFGNRELVTPDYLHEMGMESELLGRVNLHVHIPNVKMDEILEAVDEEKLFERYQKALELTDADITAARLSVKERIKEIWNTSVIGYRVIQRVTHQYFLHNGEYPPETSLEAALDGTDDTIEEFE